MYCVSVTGVTGARGALPADLKSFLGRVRSHSQVPLAVGFGISTPEQVNEVSKVAEAVVVGSAIISNIDANLEASAADRAEALRTFIESLSKGIAKRDPASFTTSCTDASPPFIDVSSRSFGEFGGRYIPETLVDAHRELEEAYRLAQEVNEILHPSIIINKMIYRTRRFKQKSIFIGANSLVDRLQCTLQSD